MKNSHYIGHKNHHFLSLTIFKYISIGFVYDFCTNYIRIVYKYCSHIFKKKNGSPIKKKLVIIIVLLLHKSKK